MSVTDKVVLITGAGRPNGIGAGIARCFSADGAQVVITDLEGSPIEETLDSIPGSVSALLADAASQQSMQQAVDQILTDFGRLDVLVNNAGIGGPTLSFDEAESESPVLATSDEAWDEQLRSNLHTTFASASAAAPKLRDGGSIINIASIAALGPTATLPAYGAAKAGVVHLTKTLAVQLAPRLRVNCICPGLLWTRAWEMLAERRKAADPAYANMTTRQVFEAIVAQITPLAGEQTPEDIGNLAVFYASEKARMITGQVIAVDGGISLN